MRDAVGGAFMIKIFLIFLALYIIFVGVAVNYAKAFRVKNRIINIIEQNEGITNYTDNSSSSVLGQIKESLNEYHYKVQGINRDQCPESQYGYMNDEYGYCIGLVTTGVENDGIVYEYYRVKTYVIISFPFFEDGLSFRIPIKGETRKIERIAN